MKTQKIRIKVLIDGVGHYCGYGWDGATSNAIDETLYEVIDGPAMKEYWLEAEVPIPEIAPEIIQANVINE